MSRFTQGFSTVAPHVIEERLKRVEQELEFINNVLSTVFVRGRLRTDRSAPANSTDVLPLDAQYDIVRTANYEYILINDSGTLEWRRVTYNSF